MATSTDRVTTITFTDETQGVTFTKSSTIVLNSMRLEENLTSGGLTFGEPCSSMFRCKLEYDSDFPVSRKTKIQVTQLIDNQTTVTLFTGMIDSITTDALGKYVSITAYDRMYFLKNKSCLKWWKNYWSDSTNDFTVRGIRENLLLNYSVNFESKEMMNDTRKFEEPLEFKQITVGELLSYTCAINLAIPHYGRGGILNFIELGTTTDHTIDTTDVEIENCDIETFNTATIDGCSVESSTQCVVSDEDSQTDADNVFCLPYNMFFNGKKYATMLKRAKEFVSVLANYTYRPMSAKMIVSDYDLKLGDRVQLDAYYNGNSVSYYTYIFKNVLSGPMLIEQTFSADGEPDYDIKVSANIGGKVNSVETEAETLELFLAGTYGKVSSTDSLTGTWTEGTGLPSGNAVSYMAYGFETIFAIVVGKIYSSTDGETWSLVLDIYTTYEWSPTVVKRLNDKIIVLCNDGNIVYTEDGTTWTAINTALDNTYTYYDITYGAGVYVISASNGRVCYSTDLSTWTTNDIDSARFYCVAYLNSAFYVGGSSGTLYESTDGISWTSISTGISYGIENIVFENSVYVLCAEYESTGSVYYSSDGTTWTQATSSITSNRVLSSGNGLFFAIGRYGIVEYSSDGSTWTTGTTAPYTSSILSAVFTE